MSAAASDPNIGSAGITDGESAALIARLRRRDPEALALVFDRLGRRAFGLAYQIVGNGAEAEDVVQDTFLTLWRQADRLDPERGHLTGLILTVAHRKALDAVRARRRREAHQAPFDSELEALDAIDVEASAIADLDGQAVRQALQQIPEEQRRVIELAYFQGYTHLEIAAQLRLPIGTVKSRMRLGLSKLRDAHSGGRRDGL